MVQRYQFLKYLLMEIQIRDAAVPQSRADPLNSSSHEEEDELALRKESPLPV
jgi:hypothetical protein